MGMLSLRAWHCLYCMTLCLTRVGKVDQGCLVGPIEFMDSAWLEVVQVHRVTVLQAR